MNLIFIDHGEINRALNRLREILPHSNIKIQVEGKITVAPESYRGKLLEDIGYIQRGITETLERNAHLTARSQNVSKMNEEMETQKKQDGEFYYNFAKMQEDQFNAAFNGMTFIKLASRKFKKYLKT